MQAGAGTMDEVLQSVVLEDVGGDTDDIQKEFDEADRPPELTRNWPG